VLALAAGVPVAAAAPAAAAAKTYTITDMGSLGFGESVPYGINATGQVTGLSYTSSTYKYSCGYPVRTCTAHTYHAFLYSNGTMTDLGTLSGHNSQGNAINLSGQVAGASNTSKGGTDATLWTGKKASDLGALAPLAGSYSIAYGINDSGQVVGSWGTNASSQPFLYSNGAITALPEPSDFTASGCQARGINNTGQIAGICADANGNGHLVRWSNGTVTDLGSVGSIGGVENIENMSMSNNGQIAGWAATGTAFVYSNGTITNPSNFWPNAINDNGVMVGGHSIDSGGTVQDLNSLIPARSGYQITYATGINDNGQIVAYASDATTSYAAVLLNPS
jgi:probable HAF family extracellular repeat protein